MNVDYSDRTKQAEKDFELLRQSTGKLKEILGPVQQDLVRAQWERVEDDQGHSLYSLKISDATGEAEATFAPDELRSKTHMRVRLVRLWEDLLQTRDHKLMEALHRTVNMEENGYASESE
jgi:hypothetical protein